jgi:hypothetical protein
MVCRPVNRLLPAAGLIPVTSGHTFEPLGRISVIRALQDEVAPSPVQAMLIRLLSRPLAGLPALALLLVSLGGTSAMAQPVGPTPAGPRLTRDQQQKLCPEQRRLALTDRRARIAILQRGETCLQSALDSEAVRNCMRMEREAMRKQRRQHMDDVQALFERNGLPAPQWKKRQGPRQGPVPSGEGPQI